MDFLFEAKYQSTDYSDYSDIENLHEGGRGLIMSTDEDDEPRAATQPPPVPAKNKVKNQPWVRRAPTWHSENVRDQFDVFVKH